MKAINKLILIISAIVGLDYYFGFDARFTIINSIWCIPIAIDFFQDIKKD